MNPWCPPELQIHLSERAIKGSEAGELKLESGKVLAADLVIWTGSRPNTEWLQGTELAASLDESGRLKVQGTLQVVGFPNVFAIGDINDVKEEKLGYLATQQGRLTGKNLVALSRNQALTAWTPSGGSRTMLLSLGRYAGAGHVGWIILFSFLVALIKGKDLFTAKARRQLGVA